MGFVMFTKFTVRIQKAIKQLAAGNPVHSMATLLLQEVIGDMDDVTDQTIFTKNFGAMLGDPMGDLAHVFTPTLFETLDLLNGAIASATPHK